jgi:hypothetical protein
MHAMGIREIRGRPIAVAALSAAALASSLAFASGAEAAQLYSQQTNFGGSVASSDPAGPDNATELADDFVVPPGQTWTINFLTVQDNTFDPASLTVYMYSNGAGAPGTKLETRLDPSPDPVGPDRVVEVTPTITLGPGTYWLAVQADSTSWEWVTNTVVTGFSAAWKREAPGTCMGVFMPVATCLGGAAADAAFRIGGTSQSTSGSVSPPVSGPVATPATPTQPAAAKKCKKKRRASAAAKKCRKRGR